MSPLTGTADVVAVLRVASMGAPLSLAAARAGPPKHVGRLGTVSVVVIVAAVHHVSWAAARAGP